jgi:hypothetical protein
LAWSRELEHRRPKVLFTNGKEIKMKKIIKNKMPPIRVVEQKKELQMPRKAFYDTLKQMLEHHTLTSQMPKKMRMKSIELYGSLEEQTLSYYDDFYDFLEHWEDYKKKKWSD